eukprot:CAMPEP_0177740152 /NCGR_PEP_ID=MMETSP0484_2-20121128/27411_1 /TAXON_ID=354590 /ORGANISM="Rhodomonas lens, Strain RHODO" /LENGTH=115 /DNA_ID=CAMNT_0019254271 /DNA_START=371 /DNA_END=715 /DNA_ORIENTATION=-
MSGSGEETGSACGSRKGSALWLGSKRWMRVRGGGMEPGAQPAAHTPHVGGREVMPAALAHHQLHAPLLIRPSSVRAQHACCPSACACSRMRCLAPRCPDTSSSSASISSSSSSSS